MNMKLELEPRTVRGKKVKYLRQQGLMPATVYGKGIEPLTVQVGERTFMTTYNRAGKSTLVELTIPGQPRQSAFIVDIQRHPVTRTILHADFHVVDLKQEMSADVPVTLTGISPFANRNDILLNHLQHSVTVRALPADLPSHLEIDISTLDDPNATVYVRDLPQSTQYEIETDPDEPVVTFSQTSAAAAEADDAELAEAVSPQADADADEND